LACYFDVREYTQYEGQSHDMDRAAINKIPSQEMVDRKGLVWNYILVLDCEFKLV